MSADVVQEWWFHMISCIRDTRHHTMYKCLLRGAQHLILVYAGSAKLNIIGILLDKITERGETIKLKQVQVLTLDVKQSYCCFDYFNLSIKLFRSTKIFLISSRFIQSAAKLDFTILPIMYFHKADDVLIWVSRSSFYSGVAAFHNENLIVATFQHWTTISSLKCGHEISLDSSTFVPHHLLMILWKFSSTITCTYVKLCRNSTNKWMMI